MIDHLPRELIEAVIDYYFAGPSPKGFLEDTEWPAERRDIELILSWAHEVVSDKADNL